MAQQQPGGQSGQSGQQGSNRITSPPSVLSEAGLVEREQRGRWAFYHLRPKPLRLMAEALVPRTPAA